VRCTTRSSLPWRTLARRARLRRQRRERRRPIRRGEAAGAALER
jgi:hypothetical protein